MTSHRRALDLAAASIDWSLTAAESDEMAAHLATCDPCQRANAIQVGQATSLRDSTFTETPASVRSVVIAAVANDTRRRRRGWTLLAAAGLVALAALGAAVGSGLLEGQREATSLEVSADPIPQPTSVFTEPSVVPVPSLLGGGPILIRDSAPASAWVVSSVDAGTGQRTPLGRVVDFGARPERSSRPPGLDIRWDAAREHVLITTEFGDLIARLEDPTEAARELAVICCEPQDGDDLRAWKLSPKGDRVAGLHSTSIQVPGIEGARGIEDAVVVFDVGRTDVRVLPLPAGSIVNRPISWSPDGSGVVVAGCRPCNNAEFGRPPTATNRAHLFIVPIDGSPVIEVLDEARATVGSPAWSPDGSALAFNTAECLPASVSPYCEGGRATVQTVSLADGRRTVVADRPVSTPVWSPDGGRIAFGRDDGVFVTNADGSDLIKVADGSDPRWSPDGRWILYSVSVGLGVGDLWIVRADGGEPRLIGTALEGGW
jgi:hypothetical protein